MSLDRGLQRLDKVRPLNNLSKDLRITLARLLKNHKSVYRFAEGWMVSQMLHSDELCFAIIQELSRRGKETELRNFHLDLKEVWTFTIYGQPSALQGRADNALLAVAKGAEQYIERYLR